MMLICSYVNGQDIEVLKRIDSIVTSIDFKSIKGIFDTSKGSLLNEGNITSDIFILKQDQVIQKISIINQSKKYSEEIVFQNRKPVFVQCSLPDGASRRFYLIGENAYLKDEDKFNRVSGTYWYAVIDSYLSLVNAQVNK